jgi:hypothetical protein
MSPAGPPEGVIATSLKLKPGRRPGVAVGLPGSQHYTCPEHNQHTIQTPPVADAKSKNTTKMDRTFVGRWKRIRGTRPSKETLTDQNIADFLTHSFRYTAKCRPLPEDEYSKGVLDQAKTHVSQWLGEFQMPRFI